MLCWMLLLLLRRFKAYTHFTVFDKRKCFLFAFHLTKFYIYNVCVAPFVLQFYVNATEKQVKVFYVVCVWVCSWLNPKSTVFNSVSARFFRFNFSRICARKSGFAGLFSLFDCWLLHDYHRYSHRMKKKNVKHWLLNDYPINYFLFAAKFNIESNFRQ